MLKFNLCKLQQFNTYISRFPKTGGFRRAIGPDQWKWLTPLLDLLDQRTEPQSPSLPQDPQWHPDDLPVDSHGFPTIFRRLLGCKAVGELDLCAAPPVCPAAADKALGKSDSVSTLGYPEQLVVDKDGFPLCFGMQSLPQSPEADHPDNLTEQLIPIMPRTRQRKRMVTPKKRPAASQPSPKSSKKAGPPSICTSASEGHCVRAPQPFGRSHGSDSH